MELADWLNDENLYICMFIGCFINLKDTGGVKKSVISVKIESEEKQKCDNR